METTTQFVMDCTPKISIDIISRMFSKIYKQFAKENISVIEKEVAKMIPSEDSVVFMGAGYGDGMVTVSVYVSHPLPVEEVGEVQMDKVFLSWLIKANIEKLHSTFKCFEMQEQAEGNSFFIDGIPASYDEDDNEYYFHFTITKQ